MLYFKAISILWLFFSTGSFNPWPIVVSQCYSIQWDDTGRSIVQPVNMSYCK